MVIEVAVVTLTINHKGQRYKTATINLQWSIDPFYSTVTVQLEIFEEYHLKLSRMNFQLMFCDLIFED